MKNLNDIKLDPKIRTLVEALAKHGLNPVWSCQGTPGHLCARPTIIMDTDASFRLVERTVKAMWGELGMAAPYWLSAVRGYGTPWSCSQMNLLGRNTSYYMLQLQVNADYLPFPIASRLAQRPRWARTKR